MPAATARAVVFSGGGDQPPEVLVVERAAEALAEEHGIALEVGRNPAVREHVGKVELASRLQHPEDLAEDARLVGREVDHAVRDDQVDRGVADRQVLDLAQPELDVLVFALRLVRPGPLDHGRRHVDADDAPVGDRLY